MKFPLLTIIIVFLLQSGYTAYNALHRPIESLFAVNELTSGTNPIAYSLDQYEAWNPGNDDQGLPRFRRDNSVVSPANRRGRIRQTVLANPVLAKVDRKPPVTRRVSAMQLVAVQRPLESVTITYPRPMQTSRDVGDYAVQAGRISENKSFFSKTTSVLKKPFKWVKAFGTKLL